jgi:cytidine deaminase
VTTEDDKTIPADLIALAIQAAYKAYAPYSHYLVGAVLRSIDGQLFTGCNVENAAYPATICGERTALVKAVSEGQREFDLIVIATVNAGAPCGHCRQMLYEFAPNLRVVGVDFDGTVHLDTTLAELLPTGFGPSSLPKPVVDSR